MEWTTDREATSGKAWNEKLTERPRVGTHEMYLLTERPRAAGFVGAAPAHALHGGVGAAEAVAGAERAHRVLQVPHVCQHEKEPTLTHWQQYLLDRVAKSRTLRREQGLGFTDSAEPLYPNSYWVHAPRPWVTFRGPSNSFDHDYRSNENYYLGGWWNTKMKVDDEDGSWKLTRALWLNP